MSIVKRLVYAGGLNKGTDEPVVLYTTEKKAPFGVRWDLIGDKKIFMTSRS